MLDPDRTGTNQLQAVDIHFMVNNWSGGVLEGDAGLESATNRAAYR